MGGGGLYILHIALEVKANVFCCVRNNLWVVDVQAFTVHPYLCKGRKSILYFHDKCYHELRIQVLNALYFLRLLFRLSRTGGKNISVI